MWPFGQKSEEENRSAEDPSVRLTGAYIETLLDRISNTKLPPVTVDGAMRVPAFFAGVAFLSETLSTLPISVFQVVDGASVRMKGHPVEKLLRNPSSERTSSGWRQQHFFGTFTIGTGLSVVERSEGGAFIGLHNVDPSKATISKPLAGSSIYDFRHDGKTTRVAAANVIDTPFLRGLGAFARHAPIKGAELAIQLATAAAEYGAKGFLNGGVPPLALNGPFGSAEAAERASSDIAKAISKTNKQGKQTLAIPAGHKLEKLGFNASEMQLIDLQRFIIEEIARVLGLPPVFLQDLTRGTFSNTEQQDLQLVKHVIRRWAVKFEEELVLKLFTQKERDDGFFVKMNVDALLRGDFKTRANGIAKMIQNGLLTPNEGRELDDRKPLPNGDDLLIQGATVPLGSQPMNTNPTEGGKDEAEE